ncbi:hypothetical protein BGX20_009049, partial [Mortierella sp. AD010]
MAGSLLQQRVEAEKQEIEQMKLQLKMREQAGVLGARAANEPSSSQHQHGGHRRGLSTSESAPSLVSSMANQPVPKFGGPGTLIEKGETRAAQLLERSKSSGTGLRPSNGSRSDFQRSRSRSRGPPEDRMRDSRSRSPRSHSPTSIPSVPSMPQAPLLQFEDPDAMIQPGLIRSRTMNGKQQGSPANSMGGNYNGHYPIPQARNPGTQHAGEGQRGRQAGGGSSNRNLTGSQSQSQSGRQRSRSRARPLVDLGNINTSQDVI